MQKNERAIAHRENNISVYFIRIEVVFSASLLIFYLRFIKIIYNKLAEPSICNLYHYLYLFKSQSFMCKILRNYAIPSPNSKT